MIGDSEPQQSGTLSGQRLDIAHGVFGVAMNRFQNLEGGFLFNCAEFFCDLGPKKDFFFTRTSNPLFAQAPGPS